MVEHEGGDTDRRGERHDVGRDEEERCDEGAEQQGEHEEDDEQDRGDQHLEVTRAGLEHIEVRRRVASDEGLGAHLVEVVAEPLDGVLGSLAVGGVVRRRLDEDGAVDDRRWRRRLPRLRGCDPHEGTRDARIRDDDLERGLGVALGHDDLDRGGGARGEVLADDPLGDDRVGVGEERLVDRRAAGLEGRHEGGRGQEQDERDGPGAARVAPDEVGHPSPHTGRPDDVLCVDVVELGGEGPEGLAPEQEQHGGEERQRRQQRAGDAQRPDRPESGGAPKVGEQQAEQGEDDGGRGRHDRLDSSAPGTPQRHPRARLVVELLAEPADEQEGVVGRRTDHEDEQDALRLPGQGDDVVEGELVDDERGRAEPEDGTEEHGDGQDRAAVDDEQDDEHDEQGDAQEDSVDARERCGEVGDQSARAPHVGLETGWGQGGLDLLPQGIRPLDEGGGLAVGLRPGRAVEGNGDQHRLPVLGGNRGGGVARVEEVTERAVRADLRQRQTGQVRGELGDGALVLGRERTAVLALDDDEVGQRRALVEPRDCLADEGGLGVLGQEGGVVVGLDSGQLALGLTAEAGHDEPDEEHEKSQGDHGPRALRCGDGVEVTSPVVVRGVGFGAR